MINTIKKSDYPDHWDSIINDNYDFIEEGHRKGSSIWAKAVYQISEKYHPDLSRDLDGFWMSDTFIWSEIEGIPTDLIDVLYRVDLGKVITHQWVKQNVVPVNKEGVYKIDIEYGRHGYLSGVFVETAERVRLLWENKIEVYFGEVLGKHSEVIIEFNEEKDIQLISEDPAVVKLFKENDLSTGYNPFHYPPNNEYYGYYFDTAGELIDHIISSKQTNTHEK